MAELNHIKWFRLRLLARLNPMFYKQGSHIKYDCNLEGQKGATSAVILNVWPQDSDLLTATE